MHRKLENAFLITKAQSEKEIHSGADDWTITLIHMVEDILQYSR